MPDIARSRRAILGCGRVAAVESRHSLHDAIVYERIELRQRRPLAIRDVVDAIERLGRLQQRRADVGLHGVGYIAEVATRRPIAVNYTPLAEQQIRDPAGDHRGVRPVGVLTRAEDVEVAEPEDLDAIVPCEDGRVQLVDVLRYG